MGGVVSVIGLLLLLFAIGTTETTDTFLAVFGSGIGGMMSAGIVYLLAEIAEHTCPHSRQEMEAARSAAPPAREPGKVFVSARLPR